MDGLLQIVAYKYPEGWENQEQTPKVHQLARFPSRSAPSALDRVVAVSGRNKLRPSSSLTFPSKDDNFPGN